VAIRRVVSENKLHVGVRETQDEENVLGEDDDVVTS